MKINRPMTAQTGRAVLGMLVLLWSAGPVAAADGAAREVAPPPVITATDRTDAMASLLSRADTALATGRPAAALDLYDQAARLDPRSAGIRYGRARSLELLGRAGEAAQAYRATLAADPDHDGAAAGLAGLVALENPEAALTDLRRLQSRRPADPHLATRLGLLEAGLGRWNEALPQFELAARLLPEDAAAQHNLAVARDRTGDAGGAVEAYERALELPPVPGVPLAQARDRLNALRNR